MPTPLEASVWDFPTLEQMPQDDLVILGADLKPETVIDSYKHGNGSIRMNFWKHFEA